MSSRSLRRDAAKFLIRGVASATDAFQFFCYNFHKLRHGMTRRFVSMTGLKNISKAEVLTLKDEVAYQKGQVVSKTLAQNAALSVTLFSFDKGEEISTHDSTGDAMVHVIEGVGQFTVDGVEHICKAGDVLVMPAKKPHAVFAKEDFKMLLTVIFPLD